MGPGDLLGAALVALGAHRLVTLARVAAAAGPDPHPRRTPGSWPRVLVQLPVYREPPAVVDGLLAAVEGLEYPRERLAVQLLSDAPEPGERAGLARRVEQGRARGVPLELRVRETREGFKAGALAAGLAAEPDAARIAILDADFRPGPGWLREAVEVLEAEPGLGCVQHRWLHPGRDASALAAAQALLLDAHFGLEHPARARHGLYLNFNGTAGVWRREAIEAAGGWQGDTLTEDLDLSYRAQLAGYRIAYLAGSGVEAGLPEALGDFRRQQRRWARGSIQVARKLLGRVLRAPVPVAVKLEACAHLLGPLGFPLLLAAGIVGGGGAGLGFSLLVGAGYYLAAGWVSGRGARTWADLPGALVLGASLAGSGSWAVVEGIWGETGLFERTPKGTAGPADRGAVADLALAGMVLWGCRDGAGPGVWAGLVLAGALGWSGLVGLGTGGARTRALSGSRPAW